MNITWLSWVAASIIFLGNFILIKNKSWKVFIIFAIGNMLYAFYWITQHQWATLLLVSLFVFQNIYGIIRWQKEQVANGIKIEKTEEEIRNDATQLSVFAQEMNPDEGRIDGIERIAEALINMGYVTVKKEG